MSLSTCEHCGGHIPLGPNASNCCEKCGRGVFNIPDGAPMAAGVVDWEAKSRELAEAVLVLYRTSAPINDGVCTVDSWPLFRARNLAQAVTQGPTAPAIDGEAKSRESEETVRRLTTLADLMLMCLDRPGKLDGFDNATVANFICHRRKEIGDHYVARAGKDEEDTSPVPPITNFGNGVETKPPTQAATGSPLVSSALDGKIVIPRRLLDSLTSYERCHFDHHGGCQEHGYLSLQPGEKCPHQEAKDLLAQTTTCTPEAPAIDWEAKFRERAEAANKLAGWALKVVQLGPQGAARYLMLERLSYAVLDQTTTCAPEAPAIDWESRCRELAEAWENYFDLLKTKPMEVITQGRALNRAWALNEMVLAQATTGMVRQYIHEDQLPDDMTEEEYGRWYAKSWIMGDGHGGVRVGPLWPMSDTTGAQPEREGK